MALRATQERGSDSNLTTLIYVKDIITKSYLEQKLVFYIFQQYEQINRGKGKRAFSFRPRDLLKTCLASLFSLSKYNKALAQHSKL